jgi:hypothetical protein
MFVRSMETLAPALFLARALHGAEAPHFCTRVKTVAGHFGG